MCWKRRRCKRPIASNSLHAKSISLTLPSAFPSPSLCPEKEVSITSKRLGINRTTTHIITSEAFTRHCQADWIENPLKWNRLIELHERNVVVVVRLRVARMFHDSFHLREFNLNVAVVAAAASQLTFLVIVSVSVVIDLSCSSSLTVILVGLKPLTQ